MSIVDSLTYKVTDSVKLKLRIYSLISDQQLADLFASFIKRHYYTGENNADRGKAGVTKVCLSRKFTGYTERKRELLHRIEQNTNFQAGMKMLVWSLLANI